MARYCLLGHVDPAKLDEYKMRHAAVWPELLLALRDAGWRNYSLFLRPDGLLIGYCESDDLDAAQQRVAATEINAKRRRTRRGSASRRSSTSRTSSQRPATDPSHHRVVRICFASSRTRF